MLPMGRRNAAAPAHHLNRHQLEDEIRGVGLETTRRICFLHIGTHKTGTTSIQRMLAFNEKRLDRAGVHIPSASRPPGFDGHHNIAWELNADPRFEPGFGALASVVAEVLRRSASTVCLSSEDFEYLHAKPERLCSLYRAFEAIGYTVKIILHLRPQQEYERSLFHELANHHGITETAEEFHMLVARDGAFRCRESWIFQFEYDRLIEPFTQVFGTEHVIVQNYRSVSPDSQLLIDFLQIILPPNAELAVSDLELPARLNRTTSA